MTYFDRRPGAAIPARPRLLEAATVVVSGLLAGLTALRILRAWPAEAYLGYAEGIWSVLAIDVAHGTFYRPLDGPLGYGGTRYFPLFFTAHGALIRAGFSPVTAGHLVATAAVILLVSAVVWLVRLAGGRPITALAAGAAVLACQPTQMALLTIRGDGLAAALALTGVALVAARRPPWLAAGAFTLAFATKPTSAYAPVAAWLWLWLSGHRAAAWRIAWQTALGFVVLLAVMQAASAGRALAVIAASASGGGTWRSLLVAPIALAHILRRVPESLACLMAAVVVILRVRPAGWSIAHVAFGLCALATVAIFASPATVENHLVDLVAWSVIVAATWATRDTRRMKVVTIVLLVGGLTAGATAAARWRERDGLDARTAREHALAAVADVAAPVFVEQPMLAAKAGWQAFLVDPYLFSLRVTRDPHALDRLLDDLDQQRFGAVILEHSALDLAVQDTFPGPAGSRFLTALREHYTLAAVVDGRPIFRPR